MNAAKQNIANDISCLSQLIAIGKISGKGNNPLAACFAELAGLLEENNDVHKICEALPYDGRQFDIVDFTNSMANLGFESKVIKSNFNDIDARLYPCLFVPASKKRTPKVIISDDGEKVLAYDGGKRVQDKLPKDKSIKGKVYLFRKFQFEEQQSQNSLRRAIGHSWFKILLERFRGIFMHVFAVSTVLNFVSLATAIFIMMVYDHVVAARASDKLIMLLIGVSFAILVEWGLRELRSASLSWFSARLDFIVSSGIFKNLLSIPPALIEHGSVAAQVARLKAFESVRDFFTGPLFLVIIELPFTLITLGAIAIISGWLALIPVVTAILYVILMAVTHPRMKLAIHASAKASTLKQQNYIETFDKLHSLKTNGLHEVWQEQFRDISGKSSLIAFKSNMLSSLIDVIAHALAVISGMMVVYFGVQRVLAGDMSAGALVAVLILVWRVLSPLQILCGAMPRLEQLKQSIAQVNKLMEITTEQGEELISSNVSILKGKIGFNRVGIRYSKATDPVFANLSFEVQQGQMVAIAGTNGTGKSTLLKLANGLYKPQAGTIKIDDIDIRQINPQMIRRQIAYVAQVPEFFHATIAENLRYAEPLASDDDIREVLIKADAFAEIEELADGIQTMIGGRLADQLSSSLAYKLSLARAYLKNTSILLLDELPYELLASRAGEIFKQNLQMWKGVKTVFLVTHRDDFIEMADMAILLQTGKDALVGKPKFVIEILKNIKEKM